jgi:hypothetical protein
MKVGSFVECIDDKFSAEQLSKLQSIPKEGDYYTIREIIEYPKYNRTGVRLEEIANPPIEMEVMVQCMNPLIVYLDLEN